MPKSSKGSKSSKSKSSKKSGLNEKKPDNIKEKVYITKEIETSITLLESSENSIVLESLLFLSKYADIQTNNLNFLQAHGILPKLLALLGHNICILRVALRLLSLVLTTNAANIELNEEKFDVIVLKICKIYTEPDLSCKEYAITVLAIFSRLGRSEILLQEDNLIKTILKSIKAPENDVILFRTLELFSKLIEIQKFLVNLSLEENFNLPTFLNHMYLSEDCFKVILSIFEKITYFGEDSLQIRLKECNLVEHMFTLIIDPAYTTYQSKCLNIVVHSMGSEKTNSYFIQSLKFLQFCRWVKTCSSNVLAACAYIFLELAKIDEIRQVLFDLSVEDSILSFLRSEEKDILLMTCEAISHMSKHKYCCEKMVNPIVIKKLLFLLNTPFEPKNEAALTTLHYFARRDSRTIHMICAYDGVAVLLKYLKLDLSEPAYQRLLEVINMIVTNYQLQNTILTPDLYGMLLDQVHNKSNEITIRSLEILINCESHNDFQDYFLGHNESTRLVNKLGNEQNETVINILVVFIHNAMVFNKMAMNFVRSKLLLVLKALSPTLKTRIPLIERLMKLIYDCYLPLKFFETGRLDVVDRLTDRFYIIDGVWTEKFPFLEVLQMRACSTKNTIYVVELMWQELDEQCSEEDVIDSVGSLSSISLLHVESSLKFGFLSNDLYMLKYIKDVKELIKGVVGLKERIKLLAQFIDRNLCGPDEEATGPDKIHTFHLHIQCIREKLGTNMIPLGYLRLGFHCERALLFKALADQVCIPASLVKGKKKLYWNEIGLIEFEKNCTNNKKNVLRMFVVDLMNNIGQLLPVGSRDCNAYCDIQ